jgi:hypothetical protein
MRRATIACVAGVMKKSFEPDPGAIAAAASYGLMTHPETQNAASAPSWKRVRREFEHTLRPHVFTES